MKIDSSGNLGIGTSSPLAKLHTSQTSGGVDANILFQNSSTTTSTAVALYLSPTTGSLTTGSIRSAFIKGINVGGNVTALTFGTNSSGADPTEKMRITSAGNVGIGTSSPVGKLDVAGTEPTLNIRDTQSKVAWAAGETVGTLDFYSNDTSGVGAQAVSRIRSVADTASAATSGALAFWTAAAGAAATDKVRITSTGNVGIGTTSPGSKLDVNGTITATQYIGISGGTF
jgi:uncharacterized membrane protein